ncbi:hypothetical protein [Nonomuraea fuscirosea]|uniref:hypothetical protein n=1 Tax=Nonomuraea fuscirosea TaxID=1291556 RepID=UPI0034245926
MSRQAIALFVATSAVLLAPAGTANAEEEAAFPPVECTTHDGRVVNVTPPPPWLGTVTADVVGGLMDSVAGLRTMEGAYGPGAGTANPYAPPAIPAPAPTPPVTPAPGTAEQDGETMEGLIYNAVVCSHGTNHTTTSLLPPEEDPERVARYLETLFTTSKQACAPTAPRPKSLLSALGVQQLVDSLIAAPAPCLPPAQPGQVPQEDQMYQVGQVGQVDQAPTSLLDAIGVTDLLNSLSGD